MSGEKIRNGQNEVCQELTVLDIALLNKLLISILIVTNITYWPV